MNPRLVFDRLFASDIPKVQNEGAARRAIYKKSILDFVLEDAKSLASKVGGRDKEKLDQYLTAIREIEGRIENAEKMVASAKTNPAAGYEIPEGVPESYEHHAKTHVRHDGARLPVGRDACLHLHARERRLEPQLPEHRRRGRASHAFASRRRSREADEDPRDQSLPRAAVCLCARPV